MGIITRAVHKWGRRELAFFVRKVRGARSEQNTLANMHAKLAMTDGPTHTAPPFLSGGCLFSLHVGANPAAAHTPPLLQCIRH